jgi:hypothetical protein
LITWISSTGENSLPLSAFCVAMLYTVVGFGGHMVQVRGEKTRRLAVLDAPTDLGLKPSGVDVLAAALRGTGLVEQLGATYAGEIRARPYDAARDPETKILNSGGIRDHVTRLADAVGGPLGGPDELAGVAAARRDARDAQPVQEVVEQGVGHGA